MQHIVKENFVWAYGKSRSRSPAVNC